MGAFLYGSSPCLRKGLLLNLEPSDWLASVRSFCVSLTKRGLQLYGTRSSFDMVLLESELRACGVSHLLSFRLILMSIF